MVSKKKHSDKRLRKSKRVRHHPRNGLVSVGGATFTTFTQNKTITNGGADSFVAYGTTPSSTPGSTTSGKNVSLPFSVVRNEQIVKWGLQENMYGYSVGQMIDTTEGIYQLTLFMGDRARRAVNGIYVESPSATVTLDQNTFTNDVDPGLNPDRSVNWGNNSYWQYKSIFTFNFDTTQPFKLPFISFSCTYNCGVNGNYSKPTDIITVSNGAVSQMAASAANYTNTVSAAQYTSVSGSSYSILAGAPLMNQVTPTILSFNPSAWYDAADPLNNGSTMVPFDGTGITTWKDKSGNAWDADKALAGPAPAISLNNTNGLPMINFLQTGLATTKQFAKSADVTFFMVCNLNTPIGNDGFFWGHCEAGRHDQDIGLYRPTTTQSVSFHTNNSSSPSTLAPNFTTVLYNCTMSGGTIIDMKQISSSGILTSNKTQGQATITVPFLSTTKNADLVTLYTDPFISNLFAWDKYNTILGVIDSTSLTATVVSTINTKIAAFPTITFNNNVAPIYIGATAYSAIGSCYIGEIIYFQKILPAANQSLVELYLATKWGLASYLDSPSSITSIIQGINGASAAVASSAIYDGLAKITSGAAYVSAQNQAISGATAISAVNNSIVLGLGPASWFDAMDPLNGGGTPADGSTMTAWKDKSGNTWDADRSVQGVNLPKYRKNGMNGLPMVDFSNAAGLTTTRAMAKSLDVTFIMVAMLTYPSQTEGVYWGHFEVGRRNSDISLRRWTGPICWHTNSDDNGLISPMNIPVMYTCTMKDGMITYMKQMSSAGFLTYNANRVVSINTSLAPIWLGTNDGGSTSGGYLAEIMYFQKVLPDTSIASLEMYLANKWGLAQSVSGAQGILASSANYKTAGLRSSAATYSGALAATDSAARYSILGPQTSQTIMNTTILKLMPAAWYDALDPFNTGGLSMPRDGDSFTLWKDKSGNGWDADIQAGGSSPIFRTNMVNGLPLIDFTNPSGLTTSKQFAKSADVTFFMVCMFNKPDAKHSNGIFWGHFEAGRHDDDICIKRYNNTAKVTWHTSSDDNGIDSPYTIPVLYVCTMKEGTVTSMKQYSSAGSFSYAGLPPNRSRTITTVNAPIWLGVSEYADYTDSYLGEVIYFKKLLADTDINSIGMYLSTKWNNQTYSGAMFQQFSGAQYLGDSGASYIRNSGSTASSANYERASAANYVGASSASYTDASSASYKRSLGQTESAAVYMGVSAATVQGASAASYRRSLGATESAAVFLGVSGSTYQGASAATFNEASGSRASAAQAVAAAAAASAAASLAPSAATFNMASGSTASAAEALAASAAASLAPSAATFQGASASSYNRDLGQTFLTAQTLGASASSYQNASAAKARTDYAVASAAAYEVPAKLSESAATYRRSSGAQALFDTKTSYLDLLTSAARYRIKAATPEPVNPMARPEPTNPDTGSKGASGSKVAIGSKGTSGSREAIGSKVAIASKVTIGSKVASGSKEASGAVGSDGVTPENMSEGVLPTKVSVAAKPKEESGASGSAGGGITKKVKRKLTHKKRLFKNRK
jgi:hypothetical protein